MNLLYLASSILKKRYYSIQRDVEKLYSFIDSKKKLVVITGAGCSTESGIPDYRGVNGTYSLGHKPMTYQQFTSSQQNQQRYWYRSMIGWPSMSTKIPSNGHKGLYDLLEKNKIFHIITQNVDRLHHKIVPQSKSYLLSQITELHGSLYEVICLNCYYMIDRNTVQELLINSNPQVDYISELLSYNQRPDGDVETKQKDFNSFVIPRCKVCNSENNILKPNVVFFGENVPVKKVQATFSLIEEADGILVVGSTLEVFSSYRFVIKGLELGLKVCVVNQGETRVDNVAYLKIDQKAGEIFSEISKRLLE